MARCPPAAATLGAEHRIRRVPRHQHPAGHGARPSTWHCGAAVTHMEDRGGAGTVAASRTGCAVADPGSRGVAVTAAVPGSALRELTRQHRSLGRQLTAGRGATEPSHLRVRCSARWAGPRRFGHPSSPARRDTPSRSQRCWGIWVPRCLRRGPACSHGEPFSNLALLPVPTGKGMSSCMGWGSSMGSRAEPALRCCGCTAQPLLRWVGMDRGRILPINA